MDYGVIDDRPNASISREKLLAIAEQQNQTFRECMEIQRKLKAEEAKSSKDDMKK